MHSSTSKRTMANRGTSRWAQGLFAAAAMTLSGCNNNNDSSDTAVTGFDVEEATISEVHTAMLNDELSCADLVETYLDRIQRLDQDLAGGWPINSVLWINENVRQEAAALDQYLAQYGEFKGSLHCVPVLLKDNYDTADMPTTAASLTMLGAQPFKDATTVYKMRAAGAVILGKATMDAWAMGAGGESSRPRAGSPYDTAYLTSSSSSGPAAAVSANFAMVSAGSDTCGSLTSPGTYNGVVAIRSSYGLVSQDGIIPLSHSHDVGGPMARTVEDATRLLNVMAGLDPSDPVTTADPTAVRYDDYTQFLDAAGAAGKRIGVLRTYGTSTATPDTGPDMDAVNASIEVLRSLGAEIVDPIDFTDYIGHYLADYEAEDNLNAYFASHMSPVTDVASLAAHPLVHPNVAARILDRIIPQIDTDDPAFDALLQDNALTKQRLDALMDANNLDALILRGGSACALSVTTGIPYMVVPVSGARTDGDPRPAALGIMARKWDEPTMLAIAYAYETARGARPSPTVATSLDASVTLPPVDPTSYNACVEEIALKARELQGDVFRDVTPEQYLSYVTGAACTLETHRASGVK